MRYRQQLPQLDGELFLTDGGIETTLIFHQGLDLPEFAAFVLLDDDDGVDQLRRYYEPYLALARDGGTGFVLESPTWRANPDWGARIGVSAEKLDALNRRAIELMEELRDAAGRGAAPVVISGCVGPQDDGYRPGRDDERGRGTGLPLHADRDVRRHRGGHGHSDHHDLPGRGDRRDARGARRGAARRDLVHPRDGRTPAERPSPGRRDRGS